ncbi:MAG: hypothetical protein D6805_09160 [Planctomycetota bacterium]|nr:MAG: hypothetical protein D6805_09160 [Planctomycetota bacterium]
MKLCEICQESPATVKLTEIVDGKKNHLFLCDPCAKKRGILLSAYKKGELEEDSSEDIFSFSLEKDAKAAEDLQEEELVCPRCGMSYEEFRENSLLGCAYDYTAFSQLLLPILRRIHGNPQHVGKVPWQCLDSNLDKEKEIIRLKTKLKRAIEREEYEKAADIRDRIIALEGGQDGPE